MHGIVRKFEWRYDDEWGVHGWAPAKMPHFNALGVGFGIAHDVLEHFSDTDDSLEGEFMAFGSILYFRAETDWWAHEGVLSSPDPAYQMSSDMYEFVANALAAGWLRDTCKRGVKPLDTELEDILWRLKSKVLAQLGGDDRVAPDQHERFKTTLYCALDWMRRGYRKACRRWGLALHERIELFNTVIRECEPHLGHGEYGQVLRVSVNRKTGEVRAMVIEQHYPH